MTTIFSGHLINAESISLHILEIHPETMITRFLFTATSRPAELFDSFLCLLHCQSPFQFIYERLKKTYLINTLNEMVNSNAHSIIKFAVFLARGGDLDYATTESYFSVKIN